MERHGFIQDILDVKLLILYVMALVEEPVSAQTVYELCYQDERLSYFDVQEALPQMVESGHLEKREDERYVITDKGRETEEITHDSIAFPVKHRARIAVERLNHTTKRQQFIRTNIVKNENEEYTVHLGLDDLQGTLMDLSLTMPTLHQARKMEAAYRKNAEAVYQSVMISLLEEAEGEDTENS